jgi:hypothetical protein
MKQYRILVACEFSGAVRDAFIERGFNAVSCDIVPTTSDKGKHYQCDVRLILGEEWDLIIAHPPCTYLCNSGVRWLHSRPGRFQLMRDAAYFFRLFLDHPCPRICVENPIPHRYAMEIIKEPYSQTIQPWQFGHGEVKRTCLWLKGLPVLQATDVVEGRYPAVHRMSPGPERGRLRSITYPGVARAMAEQWGRTLAMEACQTAHNS